MISMTMRFDSSSVQLVILAGYRAFLACLCLHRPAPACENCAIAQLQHTTMP